MLDRYVRDHAVMISGPEGMISDLTAQPLAAALSRGQIRSERAIGPPGNWDVASAGLRHAEPPPPGASVVLVLR